LLASSVKHLVDALCLDPLNELHHFRLFETFQAAGHLGQVREAALLLRDMKPRKMKKRRALALSAVRASLLGGLDMAVPRRWLQETWSDIKAPASSHRLFHEILMGRPDPGGKLADNEDQVRNPAPADHPFRLKPIT